MIGKMHFDAIWFKVKQIIRNRKVISDDLMQTPSYAHIYSTIIYVEYMQSC